MEIEGDKVWLEKEVEDWKNQGIIDQHQAEKILSRYRPDRIPVETAASNNSSIELISVISTLGAVLIGIGAILFVASNWKKLPDFLKLIILFGTTFATYFAGWKLKYDTGSHPKIGHSFIFLASIFVGVTIFLTAQIFNITANSHWLILLWFLAISPFGYAFDSKQILGLNIFTFVLWIIFYVTSSTGPHLSFYEIIMLFLLFGISLYGLGQIHSTFKKYSHFRVTYQGVGLFFILIFYFFFSLENTYSSSLTEITTTDRTIQLLLILFAITSIISIFISASTSDKFKTVKHEFAVLLLAFAGWTGAYLMPSLFTELNPTLLFIFFNLMFFILSIGSILIGYHKFIVPFVNLGMSFFVLGILNLYFTTLYEYLPKSFAFIMGGIILLRAGWYLENKRRLLISNMESHKT